MKYAVEAAIGVVGAVSIAAAGATWQAVLIGGIVGGCAIVAVEVVAARRRS